MGTAVQICFISYHLLLIGFGFGYIGRAPEGDNRYSGTGISAFLHGMWTIGFLLWWDPTDLVSLTGMFVSIALLWVPWIIDLADIHKPYPAITLKSAVTGSLLAAARIGLVLGFWTLY